MAALRVFHTFAICILLGHQTFAKNDAPCQRSKGNNAFNTFLSRHIRTGLPNSSNKNEWEKYIRNNGGCDRPTQSFLTPKDLDKVKAICTNSGGKVYKDNLCISDQTFTFVTVRSFSGTCGIKRIDNETKHLILACEVVDNQCVPVHFEGNPDNQKPNNNGRGCQDPQSEGHAPSFKMTWLQLLFVLLIVMYGF